MGLLDDHIKEQQEKEAGIDPAVEPATEPATEPAVEPATEPAVEPATDPGTEPATEPAVEPATEDFSEEQLNTLFETTGKTKEDIRSIFSQGQKYSELEKERDEMTKERETLLSQNTELRKGLNPLSHFSSEQAYVAEQLRIKYPTMDAVAIQKAVTQDISKMSDLDVLALQDVIKHPGAKGGEPMAKRILADDYGVDPSEPAEQWDELSRAKIERKAYEAREELMTFQKEVELPSIKSEEDLKAERAQKAEGLKTQWAPALSKMSEFANVTLPGTEEGATFDFEVPQSFRDGLGEYFESVIVNGGLEPNEDTVKFLIEQRNKDFIYQNLDKILIARDADQASKLQKKTDDELNNTDPANTQTAPASSTELSGTEKFVTGHRGRRIR